MAKSPRGKMGIQGRILLAALILTSLVFYKISVLLLIGMLPTIILRIYDRTPERTKVLTVGFMNFAGCFPFCYQLFEKHGGFNEVLAIVSSPVSIVTMYGAAVVGHAIEWAAVTFVSGIMVQKGRGRLSDIKNAQDALVKKWGPEITGELPPEPKAGTIED